MVQSSCAHEIEDAYVVLQDGADMRLVCQCIEADDVFHAEWEHTASRHHHDTTARMYGVAK